jgi:hypothetical protein
MPRAWVFLRRVWIAAFTASLGLVVLLPGMHAHTRAISSVQGWILLSIATMLFLFPHHSGDVIVSSPRELRYWQIKSLLGSLLLGTCALIGAIQFDVATWECSVAVAFGVLGLCLFSAPYFFRLSAWRVWAGTALIFAAYV